MNASTTTGPRSRRQERRPSVGPWGPRPRALTAVMTLTPALPDIVRVILIGLAYAGAGRFMRYVPIPVVEGFTVGIAVIIVGVLCIELGAHAAHRRRVEAS